MMQHDSQKTAFLTTLDCKVAVKIDQHVTHYVMLK